MHHQPDRLRAFRLAPRAGRAPLIGPTDAEPLYLAIFRGMSDALQRKVDDATLSAADFTRMRCVFNDPQLSFFTMNPFVPHGECVARNGAAPPSFYVTEPARTPLLQPDWRGISLQLDAIRR